MREPEEFAALRDAFAQRTGTQAEDWHLVFKARYGMRETFSALRGIHGDGEVVTTLFTGCTAVDSIIAAGLTPRYATINPATLGMDAEAEDENTLLRVLRPGAHRVAYRAGYSLSLLALTDTVEALTVRGAKYETAGVTLRRPTTLGQSNAFVTDVELSFTRGVLALICCRLED